MYACMHIMYACHCKKRLVNSTQFVTVTLCQNNIRVIVSTSCLSIQQFVTITILKVDLTLNLLKKLNINFVRFTTGYTKLAVGTVKGIN